MSINRREIEPQFLTNNQSHSRGRDWDGDGTDDAIDNEIAVKTPALPEITIKRGKPKMKTIATGVINVLKRAFTRDGGGVLDLTNEEGLVDSAAIGAAITRVLTIVLIGLAVWLLNHFGLPGEEIIQSGTEILENSN